jgi:hypothetical protein
MAGHEYAAELLNITTCFCGYNIHDCSAFIRNQYMRTIKEPGARKQMICLKFAIRHS